MKIYFLLLKLEGFLHFSSLNLNIGCYNIELSPGTKHFCTIVVPWRKFKYQKLPLGICNSPDIFQEIISKLFEYSDAVHAYIDEINLITQNDLADHLKSLEKALHKLAEARLKVDAFKSFSGHIENLYLGFWVRKYSVRPLELKPEPLKDIYTPTKVIGIHRLVGIFNYYRYMCHKRAHTLVPIKNLSPLS